MTRVAIAEPVEAQTRAVIVGASAGAIQALSVILPGLPADYPMPVLVVVHVPSDGDSLLAPLFQAKCRMTVKEAEDKEPLAAGTIYFAPSDYHLLVEPDFTLSLSADEPVLHSRPSVDVLFDSAADAFGSGAIGVILTGANQDGAEGMAAICAAGGQALVEDPATAFAPAMPDAALARCPQAKPMSLADMATYLVELGAA